MNLVEIYKQAAYNPGVGVLGRGAYSLLGGYVGSPIMRHYNRKQMMQTGQQPGAIREFIANRPLLTSAALFAGWQGAHEVAQRGLKGTWDYLK